MCCIAKYLGKRASFVTGARLYEISLLATTMPPGHASMTVSFVYVNRVYKQFFVFRTLYAPWHEEIYLDHQNLKSEQELPAVGAAL
jgi:hypothetical protein